MVTNSNHAVNSLFYNARSGGYLLFYWPGSSGRKSYQHRYESRQVAAHIVMPPHGGYHKKSRPGMVAGFKKEFKNVVRRWSLLTGLL